MRKITFLLFVFCATLGFSQCPEGSGGQWPSSTIEASEFDDVVGISTCNYTGEYSLVSGIVPGNDYEVLIDNGAYATVVNSADDSVIAHGFSPVAFTAPAGVTNIQINWSDDDLCGETSDCFVTSIQCTSCSAPAAPNCAEEPINPVDGTVDLAVGVSTTLSWTAPSSGPTPTEYNIYIGLEADGSDLELLGSIDATSVDVTFNFFGTTYYWSVVPVNASVEADSCDLWSFTTEAFAGSEPTPLDTISLDACGTSYESSNAFDASAEGIQWIQLDYAGGCGTVEIDTDLTTGVSDTELVLFTANGNAIATDDDGGEGLLSRMVLTDLDPGTYYIATGPWNVTFSPGFDVATNNTTATGTIVVRVNAENILSTDEQVITDLRYGPNPTKDIVYLQSNEMIQGLEVFNILGQSVMRQSVHSNSPEMDMSGLGRGTYFVKITSERSDQTIRIIKQ